MKYFAYGMNTNLKSMASRCPRARSLGRASLPHYRFAFKGCATVVPEMNKNTEGVLWEITDECELSLDILEGYPGFYSKVNVWVEHNGLMVPTMTYIMQPTESDGTPSDGYVQMLREGYTEHGILHGQIDHAIVYARQHQRPVSWSYNSKLYKKEPKKWNTSRSWYPQSREDWDYL